MIAPDRPGQHRDNFGSEPSVDARKVNPGPISLAPGDNETFANAISLAGGTIAPLSTETKGLIWLSQKHSKELAEILQKFPTIEWVQLPWAGVDGFSELFADLDHAAAPLFTSAKGTYSEPVAEHALALTLTLLRELPRKSREGGWQKERTGLSLYGNRVVIVGAGGITTELIRLLEPFRTEITVVRRRNDPMPGAAKTVTADSLRDVLPETDVLVLAAASTSETRHMIGEIELALLPDHAVLVNIARGELVDHAALLGALQSGRLWGAGLDVTEPEPLPSESPLWGEPNCIVTSHSADTPLMTVHLLAERIRTNTIAFLGLGEWKGLVDTRAGY